LTSKLYYSRKFLILLFIILLVFTAYIPYGFSENNIIAGTIASALILLILIHYASVHVSKREVFSLTIITSMIIILGVFIGCVFTGFNNTGAILYAFTLTLVVIYLVFLINKLYRM